MCVQVKQFSEIISAGYYILQSTSKILSKLVLSTISPIFSSVNIFPHKFLTELRLTEYIAVDNETQISVYWITDANHLSKYQESLFDFEFHKVESEFACSPKILDKINSFLEKKLMSWVLIEHLLCRKYSSQLLAGTYLNFLFVVRDVSLRRDQFMQLSRYFYFLFSWNDAHKICQSVETSLPVLRSRTEVMELVRLSVHTTFNAVVPIGTQSCVSSTLMFCLECLVWEMDFMKRSLKHF